MQEQKEIHIVPELKERLRLSDYVAGVFLLIPSKKGMKKAIQKGWLFVNNRKGRTGDYVQGGETLELIKPVEEKKILELKLNIHFEDEYLAVVEKPAGIMVNGNKFFTLENALPFNLKISQEKDALAFAQAIHRLDYPTSGLLIIGKTISAVSQLNKLFVKKEINKKYNAIVIGKMGNEQGEINSKVDEKESRSSYKIVKTIPSEKYDTLNLLELIPHTGRRHQLRKHLYETGHPILGDKDYFLEGKISYGNGLYLHASHLEFKHPFTKENLKVESSLPKKFMKIFP